MIATSLHSQQKEMLVEVIPLAGFDAQLAYKVPAFLKDQIALGHLVRVPLRNKHELGIVVSLGSKQSIASDQLRCLLEVVQEHPVMTDDLLKLFKWCVNYYAASYESTLESMIPSFVRKGARAKQIKLIEIASPLSDTDLEQLKIRAPKQWKLLFFMSQQMYPVPKASLLKRLNLSTSVCDALIKKGFLKEQLKEHKREAYLDDLSDDAETVSSTKRVLTDEQSVVKNELIMKIDAEKFGVSVVHGVTGSGKTEVYLQAIARVVEKGGSVIFLVPEVALAPQTVSRVRDRLQSVGVKTVVWHSHLSDGERFDSWNALVQGEALVVVGARSAVFAPVKNLQLIIVDEEHEPAFKQEETPRYHGRDVAVYRAYLNDALCILGSATPSLETIHNVSVGKYTIHKMLKRVDDRQLPKIHIVDMRREASIEKATGPISQILSDKMKDRFEKKEQTILFLNRRGFATNFLCNECGHVVECPHCSIPMTLHKTDWTLKCHLCGHFTNVPKVCPKCKKSDVLGKGYGTQRIEEVIQKLLPRAKVVRIDADTMSKKNLLRSILKEFRRGKIDILVGTQMIAKGLDFPNVTLVGLVDADRSLHIEDFRATERTFQLIVQVSGRSGRGDRSGEVVVQTCTPHASPILYARQSDFEGFLSETLEQRKEFDYPPYRHLIRHVFVGKNPEKVVFYMNQWLKELRLSLGDDLEIKGPIPTPIEKIKDDYRYQFWYFTQSVSKIITPLNDLRKAYRLKMDKGIRDLVDVDPIQLS